MNNKIYKVEKNSTQILQVLLVVGVVFLWIMVNLSISLFFKDAHGFGKIIFFITLFLVIPFLSFMLKYNLYVEGNIILLESRNKKQQIRIPIDANLKLEKFNSVSNSKNRSSVYQYFVKFSYPGQKELSLRFKSKAERDAFCEDIKSINSNLEIVDSDLSNKVAKLTDILKFFKSTKGNVSGEATKDGISGPAGDKNNGVKSIPPTQIGKTGNTANFDISGILRIVFALVLIGVVVYYYMVIK